MDDPTRSYVVPRRKRVPLFGPTSTGLTLALQNLGQSPNDKGKLIEFSEESEDDSTFWSTSRHIPIPDVAASDRQMAAIADATGPTAITDNSPGQSFARQRAGNARIRKSAITPFSENIFMTNDPHESPSVWDFAKAQPIDDRREEVSDNTGLTNDVLASSVGDRIKRIEAPVRPNQVFNVGAPRGADNAAFVPDEHLPESSNSHSTPNGSSGYDSFPDTKVKQDKRSTFASSSYDASQVPLTSRSETHPGSVVRSRSVKNDVNVKSGDTVEQFRPGPKRELNVTNIDVVNDADDYEEDDEDDESLVVIRDTDSYLDKTDSSADKSNTWDVFRLTPWEDSSHLQELLYVVWRQIFKVIAYVFMFVLVFGLSVLNKGTLLLATSNIFLIESVNLTCMDYSWTLTDMQPNYTTIHSGEFSKCSAVPRNSAPELRLSCLEANDSQRNVTLQRGPYQAPLCPVMVVQWVWCLILIMCTPYVFVFIRCLWIVCFKKKKNPTWGALLFVFLIDTMYCTGLCILSFRVLPLVDNAALGVTILAGTSFFPGILNTLMRPKMEDYRVVRAILDSLAAIVQASALIAWPVIIVIMSKSGYRSIFGERKADLVWSIPLALALVSLRWWENYFDTGTSIGRRCPGLGSIVRSIRRARTKIHLLSSVWKMAITVLLMMALLSREKDVAVRDLFTFDVSSCPKHKLSYKHLPGLRLDWVWVWLINMVSGILTYFVARSAAKVRMQRLGYALPLMISTPVVFGLLVGGCEAWNSDPCYFTRGTRVPSYFFYQCYPIGEFVTMARQTHLWLALLWWLSEFWITWHIWFPKSERLAKTDRLFILPLYDGVLLEQSLLHNRNRRDEPKRQAGLSVLASLSAPNSDLEVVDDFREETHMERLRRLRDEMPMIYLCATMWHETEVEMESILRSVFRLDVDQCARRNAQEHLGVIDPDYYEFEAHVFFDDAMENHGFEDYIYQVNSFVKLLVKCVDVSASAVHQTMLKLPPPEKYPTPYGGRLEWTLPGGNKLAVHLKDKVKIRHKKRWSQVMYMYYFLGYRLWATDLGLKRKQLRAENTFLLALDGDVDFDPLSVTLLVDLMKRNEKVAAACGRIHPIGAGPLVWYQKFEYALGHWMQKATEHVLGCVLCAPGCFSLFRGASLMDDNVMRKYATISTEARQMVQFDQGEDRWLCTLLLQQGYRVEYCAASDAYTCAPEGFSEFFNQRRRWLPSTMANILALLVSWRHTIRSNEDISFLYIVYQSILFVSSIIGPGTIFLMITGALVVALDNRIDMWMSLLLNLVPVVIFILLCYLASAERQLNCAMILTGIYSLIQMLVLVGIIIQMVEQGPCSPTAIFFFFVAGVFVLGAIVHPQEFSCILHGFVYFLSIPSMYMLLIIYAMCNLHVVSWGTREVKQTQFDKQQAENRRLMQEQRKANAGKKAGEKMLELISKIRAETNEEGWTIGVGNCFRCICCPRETPKEENPKFTAILTKLDDMESAVGLLDSGVKNLRDTIENISDSEEEAKTQDSEDDDFGDEDEEESVVTDLQMIIEEGEATDEIPPQEPEEMHKKPHEEPFPHVPLPTRDDMVDPYWLEDEDLGQGPEGKLPPGEIYFFQDLIKKYLFPLEKNKKHEERVTMSLVDLRNRMSGAFLLINAIFVVLMFTLQQNVHKLHIPWPCGQNLQIEPLGFLFLIFFGTIILIQTGGMLYHRISTFLHIIATTTLRCWKRADDKASDNVQDTIELARTLGALREEDAQSVTSYGSALSRNDESDDSKKRKRSRKTVYKIVKANKTDGNAMGTVGAAFTKRLERLNYHLDGDISPEEIEKRVLGRSKGASFRRRKSISAIKLLQGQKKTFGSLRSRTYSCDQPESENQHSHGNVLSILARTFSLPAARPKDTRVEMVLNGVGNEPGSNSSPGATANSVVPVNNTNDKGESGLADVAL